MLRVGYSAHFVSNLLILCCLSSQRWSLRHDCLRSRTPWWQPGTSYRHHWHSFLFRMVCISPSSLHLPASSHGGRPGPGTVSWVGAVITNNERVSHEFFFDRRRYWDVYRQHLRGHVVEWIEKYRIGNVSPEEAEANKKIPFGGKMDSGGR